MKWLKRIGYAIIIFITLVLAALLFLREALPESKKGPEAELLADKVLAAINNEAWQKLPWVKWSFPGGHNYVWNKTDNLGIIQWGKNRVHMNLDIASGQAWQNGELVHGAKKDKLVATAWSFWCNDSFWLNPIAKIKDPGTVRSVVEKEGEHPSLMISYQSGGVTPGDSYLYQLDDQSRPISYKMWVSIIPIGGIKATFEDWVQVEGGSWLATNHKIGPMNLPITNIKVGRSFTDLGYAQDPFLFVTE